MVYFTCQKRPSSLKAFFFVLYYTSTSVSYTEDEKKEEEHSPPFFKKKMISAGIVGLNQPPPSEELLEARRKNTVLCPDDEILLDFRPCLTCRQWGTALDNMGALSCRFHPLAKNGPSGGRWWGPGVYECCGTSDDPRDKRFHSTIGIRGCCAKDCCPIDRIPYPRQIYEKDWPSVLREKVYLDINKINNDRTNREWKDIVGGLQFKGLRIDKNDRFFLARIDEEMQEARMKHKFYRNKRLSKCIRLHTEKEDGQASTFREVIVANDMKIAKMLGEYFPQKEMKGARLEEHVSDQLGKVTKVIKKGLCGTLDEAKDYFVKI